MMTFMMIAALLEMQDGRIEFEQSERVFSMKSDGSDKSEAKGALPSWRGELSPDGKRRVEIIMGCGSAGLTFSDADGKNAVDLDHGGALDPHWSPDGKFIVFNAASQIWRVDADGKNEVQLTHGDESAFDARFAPDGRISYLLRHASNEKLRHSTLMIVDADGKNARSLIEKLQLIGYAWSPDGKSIAFSVPGALKILDVEKKADRTAADFPKIDKALHSHGASHIVWSPDGKALACRIDFLGGRMVGTVLLGDDELFVIPLAGEPRMLSMGARAEPLRWTK